MSAALRSWARPARSAPAPSICSSASGPLSGRGGAAQQQCRRAGQARARARRPLRGGRRSRRLSRAQGRAVRHRHRGGARRGAVVEAAARPAEWVMARSRAPPGWSQRSPRSSAARRSRSPTRNAWSAPAAVHAPRRRSRRNRAAGRFRAQRAVPGDDRRAARGRAPHHPHGLGRSVPHLVDENDPRGDARAGAQASELVDGRRRSRSIPQP